MALEKLNISGRQVRLHSSLISADFRSQRVLCSDPWDFVQLWLKKAHKKEALFYWEQAHHFYNASLNLPDISSPLTSYYCFLNATKSLLLAKNIEFSDKHGVGGESTGSIKSLDNEMVKFYGAGILPSLCKYLNEPNNAGHSFSLKFLFWQLPFIHRAYHLTYKKRTELFIPLRDPCFIKKQNSKEAWFQAEIDKQYINSHTISVIEPGFELFKLGDQSMIRRKRRFKWSARSIETSIGNFSTYHRQIRRRIIPIFSSENRWYLKKSVNGHDSIRNSQMVIILAAMHRLSELSRYDPLVFSGHFNLNHNWLLSEFIKSAPSQFIYNMASEITGMEFIKPDSF